ncbi:MAG: di-heme oxidoredictase family protein [Flavobacteriales bacterium]
MRKTYRAYMLITLASVAMAYTACRKDSETMADEYVPVNPEYWAGGECTIFLNGAQAFSQPLANFTNDNRNQYLTGSGQFFSGFTTDETAQHGGLGPLFNTPSCLQCHVGNGRSQPPLTEDDENSGLLIRLSIAGMDTHGGPLGVPAFGTQLQTRATDGNLPEGKFFIDYESVVFTYPDGATATMHQPYINIYNTYETLPAGLLKSARNASPVFGLGLLEAISEEDIAALVDEQDENGDYISGKLNMVWNVATQSMRPGRFGWKASSPNILQQSAEAFNQDMGITTAEFFAAENCADQTNCNGGDAEAADLTNDELLALRAFVRGIAVPAPRNLEDEIVQQGRSLFYSIGCTGCHTPHFVTAATDWPELSGQSIYPYTDLLLHDLGEGLGDGRPDFDASANEWRTPPLWGIGLTKIVNPDARFLHDGRATTLEEAILWHGGEAWWARNAFVALTNSEREAVIKFLEAL